MSYWNVDRGTPWGAWSSDVTSEEFTPSEVVALTAEIGWGHDWDTVVIELPYLGYCVR